MHRFDRFPALRSATDIRLVGDNYQDKAGLLQSRAAFAGVRINLELFDRRWRKGQRVAHECPI